MKKSQRNNFYLFFSLQFIHLSLILFILSFFLFRQFYIQTSVHRQHIHKKNVLFVIKQIFSLNDDNDEVIFWVSMRSFIEKNCAKKFKDISLDFFIQCFSKKNQLFDLNDFFKKKRVVIHCNHLKCTKYVKVNLQGITFFFTNVTRFKLCGCMQSMWKLQH